MAVVMCEGGYRNVKAVYMRKTGPDAFLAEYGLSDDLWALFDEDGRKCICASDRSRLFYWADTNYIKILTLN